MAHRHIVYMMLADAAAQTRDAAALPRYAEMLEELAAHDKHQPYMAVAHRSWAVAHRLNGDYASAKERLEQALAIFGEWDATWQKGRTLFEMAELSLAQSDEADAHDYFSRALAAFETMRAVPDVERTRDALAALA